MSQKREFINIDTSKNAKRLDVSSTGGMMVIAVGLNVIFFMILFFLK